MGFLTTYNEDRTEKMCSICKVYLPVEQFYKKKAKNTTYSTDCVLVAYCKKCNNIVSRKKRLDYKKLVVNYMGGQCIRCGYNKCLAALEFHHLDPNEKEFSVSRISVTINLTEKAKKELAKGILLCSNCHREEHNK